MTTTTTTTTTTPPLPQTYRALVQHVHGGPIAVETRETPQPGPGSAILHVLAAGIISYQREVLNGTRKYPYPTPFVPGSSAIARVAAVGPDAVLLKAGDLVYYDCTIRGRDDPSAIFLSGIHEGGSAGSRKLMAGEWRDSSFAEYVKAPLENCILLPEERLCGGVDRGGLGYEIPQLLAMGKMMVAFGGLRDIRLEAGQTVIVATATGPFGGAAVMVALAMGARVIAMGRNEDTLRTLKGLSERVETVRITGDSAEEIAALAKFGPADAYFDISPPEAVKSSHVRSAMMSLRNGGRVSFMSGFLGDVPLPLRVVMVKDLKLHGKWMYSRDDMVLLVKMVEIGILRLGEESGQHVRGVFGLEEWKEALDVSAQNKKAGDVVLFKP